MVVRGSTRVKTVFAAAMDCCSNRNYSYSLDPVNHISIPGLATTTLIKRLAKPWNGDLQTTKRWSALTLLDKNGKTFEVERRNNVGDPDEVVLVHGGRLYVWQLGHDTWQTPKGRPIRGKVDSQINAILNN